MSKNETFTIVQLVAIDETGDSYYRMRWPARHIAEQRPAWRVLNLDARAAERFVWAEEADLLVVYQSHDLDLLPLIERRRAAGKKTLVEYNDNFYAPPPSTPVASAWSSPVLWQAYEAFMHRSDGVIVTGPGLKKLFSKVTDVELTVLENHMPHSLGAFTSTWTAPDGVVRVGIAGSLGHMPDYLAVLPTLRAIFDRHPNLVLHAMGNETIPQIFGLPPERIRFTPWGTMEQYYEFWRPVHIGIAPLLDTPYNRCRSDVKAIEMSACGALPILTKALPYEQFLSATKAPAYSSFSELTAIFDKLMKDPSQIAKKAEQCFNYVAKERIGPQRMERVALYEKMLPSKPGRFAWPQERGVHEIMGTQQDQTRESVVMKEIQDLFAAKKREEALLAARRELTSNPLLSGIALSELRVMTGMVPPALWDERFEQHRKVFPNDVRFLLLRTRRATTADEIVSFWDAVLKMLGKASPVYREFFANMVIQLYLEQLPKVPPLGAHAKALAKLYPSYAAIRFVAAQQLEREGDIKEAIKHCQAVIEAREIATVNQEALKSLDIVYLRTWLEGLEGRVALGSKK